MLNYSRPVPWQETTDGIGHGTGLTFMADSFSYDVFLSYNSQDKAVVSDIAGRLRVWFDE